MTDPKPFFSDEIQLIAWRDSHTNGPTVTFRLKSSEDLEAFRAITMAKDGKAGQRIAAVMVLIGEAEEPVEVAHRKLGPLAMLAVKWCRDPEFQKWITDGMVHLNASEEGAAKAVKEICQVGSRREIDLMPGSAMKFNVLIRQPYAKHLEAKR